MTRNLRSLRRAVAAFGLALLASLALAGVAAGSASAETQHWHACAEEWGTEAFIDSACSEEAVEGTGSYGLRTPAEGSAEELAMSGSSPFTLTYRDGGYGPFELECSTQTSKESTMENPSGGGAGAAEVKLSLSGCSVAELSSCQVAGPISINTTGEATEFSDKPAVRFGSGESSLFQFTLEGASCPFNYAHTIYGNFTGIAGENGSLEFTKASSNLISSGKEATLTGTSSIETAAGEALMLTPVLVPVWRLQSTPNPEANNVTFAVSCASAGECVDVGATSTGSLAQFWNGSEWSTNSPSTGSMLRDISCATSSFCLVPRPSTLEVLRWGGSAWSTLTAATPWGATSASLAALDCTSSSACMAVGSYNVSGGASRTLAEHWDGSGWSTTKAPPFEEGGSNSLKAVDCNSATLCTAVGLVGGERAALRSENGIAWESLGTPASSGGAAADLSCPSANSCTAVFGGSQVEHWDGSEWSASTAATPEGGSSVKLEGVSCTSQTACFAAGYYKVEGANRALIESWDGSTWSVQSTPVPKGSASVLGDVSCASGSACTAVGYSIDGGAFKTLAERFQ